MTRDEIESQASHWMQYLRDNNFAGSSHDTLAKELTEMGHGLPIAANLMVMLERESPLQLSMLATALSHEAVRRNRIALCLE